MSNVLGTLIAVLTFALPITLISQNSTSLPSKPTDNPIALPKSEKPLSAIVPPHSIRSSTP